MGRSSGLNLCYFIYLYLVYWGSFETMKKKVEFQSRYLASDGRIHNATNNYVLRVVTAGPLMTSNWKENCLILLSRFYRTNERRNRIFVSYVCFRSVIFIWLRAVQNVEEYEFLPKNDSGIQRYMSTIHKKGKWKKKSGYDNPQDFQDLFPKYILYCNTFWKKNSGDSMGVVKTWKRMRSTEGSLLSKRAYYPTYTDILPAIIIHHLFSFWKGNFNFSINQPGKCRNAYAVLHRYEMSLSRGKTSREKSRAYSSRN